ncbi:uncharacterized protein CEXT_481341 [Caerostris extrusa]|uniref:Uncharacterized protein n=1 Tax=Caerostris extrusa TaxID=172846 RepID=A0AAV4R7D4_CAEEX|nr:uncharacterized protein CEXT_481341 [Caerostris extrusa]
MKSCQPKANSFLWVRFLAEDCLEFSCESFRILITVLETSNCFTRVVLSTENRNSTIVLQTDVGYTMRDIRYWWLEGPRSVGMSSDVELPQFKVIGHRQRSKEVPLTTANILLTDKTCLSSNPNITVFIRRITSNCRSSNTTKCVLCVPREFSVHIACQGNRTYPGARLQKDLKNQTNLPKEEDY